MIAVCSVLLRENNIEWCDVYAVYHLQFYPLSDKYCLICMGDGMLMLMTCKLPW